MVRAATGSRWHSPAKPSETQFQPCCRATSAGQVSDGPYAPPHWVIELP